MPTPLPVSRRTLLAAGAAGLLAACGGGSGSSGGGGPVTPPPPAGTLSLLAGSLRGPGASDGPAAEAEFFSPAAVAQDAAGVIYVADTGNHTLRRIAVNGTVTTLAGSPGQQGHGDGLGAEARFSAPAAIAVTPQGDLFVVDTGNHVVRRVTPQGVVSTLAGAPGQRGALDGSGGNARFDSPRSITIDRRGDLLVADNGSAVRRVTPGGVVSTFLGSLTEAGFTVADGLQARFTAITSVTVDEDGNVTVAELPPASTFAASGRLRRFDPDGRALGWGAATATAVDVPFPASIAALPGGDIAVASVGNYATGPSFTVIHNAILRVDATGAWRAEAGSGGYLGFGFTDGPRATSLVYQPRGVAAGSDGALLFADTGNHAVRRVANGVTSTIAGDSGIGRANGPGSSARFFHPTAIAAAADGSVVVADRWNARIRRVSAAGVVSTVTGARVGSGQPAVVEFGRSVSAVAIGPDDAIYVSYVGSPTVSPLDTISRSGTLTSLGSTAGSVTALAVGPDGRVYLAMQSGLYVRRLDGTTEALLGGVDTLGVAVDTGGSVYFTHRGSHAVRVMDARGIVRVLAGSLTEAGFTDGSASAARFTRPGPLALGSGGTLFVADERTIRRITADGQVTTVAGSPTAMGTVPGPLPAALGTVNGLAWSAGLLHATVDHAVLAIGPLP